MEWGVLSVLPMLVSAPGEVLVAIVNNLADFALALDHHWYRIPATQVEKLQEGGCWHPQWLALYQTKAFGTEAYSVTYYGEVKTIDKLMRRDLFPNEASSSKSEQYYYKLTLSPLQKLARPIISQRLRRITFIPTTWERLNQAQDISDLLSDRPPKQPKFTRDNDAIASER